MNEKEQLKYNTIERLIKGEITVYIASKELNLTRQQIYRLKNKYIEEGENGFIHKNRGKENENKIDTNTIKKIENLYLKEYYDYNFEHFFEIIKDEYAISYSSLYNYFLEDDIISPLAHKKTIKLYNENIKKIILKIRKR